MLNPIITQKKHFLVYIMSFLVIMTFHFAIMAFFLGFTFLISAADALIYNGLLFLLGIGVWYIVRFFTLSEQTYQMILADHLVTGGIIILGWLFGGMLLLSTLFGKEASYIEFLNNSLAWRFVYGILIYAVIIMVYYLINYYRNYQEKLLEESRLKQAVQESELNLLKSQINPHFLFNSLNSINSLIIANPDKAREMLLELSEFLRYTVRRNEKEQVSLRDEIDNIRKYLDIEKIRFGDRLVIEEDISDECLKVMIPNMILQPLYENAIKHGVNESTDAVTITTICHAENNYLNISISNNYSPGNLSRKGKGIGLENIKRRLALHYKRHDLFEIRRNSFNFEVIIKIPLFS